MTSRWTAVALALSVAGCATGPKVVPEAFGRGQRAALVMIDAHPLIQPFGRIHGPAATYDAAPLVETLGPVVVDALSRSPRFTLLPERRVLSSAAYGQAVEADRSYVVFSMLSAPGYKHFTSFSQPAFIARELPADLAFTLSLVLYYYEGSGAANVGATLFAVDGKGNVVLRTRCGGDGDPAVSAVQAQPAIRTRLYQQALRKALEACLRELDEGCRAPASSAG